MKITRLYTGTDNQTHFEDIDLPFAEAPIGKLTSAIDVDQIFFGEISADIVIDWHNPPRSQYVLMLEGTMKIEIGDGSKRIFKSGEIVLAEDLEGKGHKTSAASPGIQRYMIITKR